MKQEQLEKLEGTVENITFCSQETGFTVLDLAVSETELITVVGEMLDVSEGEHLSLLGTYAVHPTYGQQFRAATCERALPASANAILKYLSSRAIKGIGPVMAARLVKQFGEQTLEIIEHEPERLTAVKGISAQKAVEIGEEFRRIYGVRAVMVFLNRFGVHPSICVRVWRKWGGTSIETLTQNPYLLCAGDLGLGFQMADGIARELGFESDHPHRICAGLAFILQHNLSNGHTCLPEDDLLRIASELLEVPRMLVETSLLEQVSTEKLVRVETDGKAYAYLPQMYLAERYIAARLLLARAAHEPDGTDFAPLIDTLEQQLSIQYESLQREAIAGALQSGVFILTGGPGTGKTTTINAIIGLLEQRGEKVLLAAPTGRAAKRMTEMTGREAKTIHRLLEVEFKTGDLPEFRRCERNPLDAGAIVVDEMSMVDTLLFENLLRAMRLSCRLVLVGDADQLPSVGAGNVLRDLITSEALDTVHLQEIFRQAAESLIVTNAHQIVRGELPNLQKRDNDFFFLKGSTPSDITQTILDLTARRLPKAYGFSPKWDIQILSPTRKGELGTMELNRQLQQALNPPAPDRNQFQAGGYCFRVGDKVMQVRNNYDITWEKEDGESGVGVFNGDIGEILMIDPTARMLLVRFDDRKAEYSFDMAQELELGYAVTVHKSQGSEFEAVVLPLLRESKNLYYRNLLYTAVTRARRLLILLGSEQSVAYMVRNNKKTRRYTNLARFLQDEPPI